MKRGLYAKHFGGGQVDITSGKFVFSATEAYLIEDGKIGRPVVGATLIGNGPDVLTKVTRIGHDLKLDEGVGTCQKAGQSIPVGVGLPTILVSEITVGGTRSSHAVLRDVRGLSACCSLWGSGRAAPPGPRKTSWLRAAGLHLVPGRDARPHLGRLRTLFGGAGLAFSSASATCGRARARGLES